MSTERYTTYITVKQLKAALLFAAENDVRGYLVGACIEHSTSGARLIATDGHRLICINLGEGADGEAKAAQTVRYVVDADVLASAAKLYGKSTAIAFTYERDHTPDPTRPGVTIVSAARVKVGEISTEDKTEKFGSFPDYVRTVPLQASGELAQFNSEYVHACSKARALLTGRAYNGLNSVAVAHNGSGPALVALTDDAFAVVMPRRGEPDMSPPAWFARLTVQS